MELISVGFVHNVIDRQYGRHTHLKSKITKYFSQFADKYRDFDYVWFEDKLYVDAKHGWRVKKDIEKMLNKPMEKIRPKSFSEEFAFVFIDHIEAKHKIEQKNYRKKREKEKKRNKIKNEFHKVVTNIKENKEDHRFIGSFDLEFWEHDNDKILEFGWRIDDYEGHGKTIHLIVQENLNLNNGMYSENNRFARKDSQVVPLDVAMKRFQDEFLDNVDVMIGHGLNNDFKVLKTNGMDLDISYLDTADIGAAIMNEDDKVSLKRLLNHLEIEHDDLHNAANDVEYTLKAFFELGDL